MRTFENLCAQEPTTVESLYVLTNWAFIGKDVVSTNSYNDTNCICFQLVLPHFHEKVCQIDDFTLSFN
jgi:hypothetical protein